VLKQAGFDKPPTTWDELQKVAIAVTQAGEGKRYGIGFCMRQGPAIIGHWVSFLRSNGGKFFDSKTNEIFINNAAAVEALQFYGDLLTKYKVVPPDAVTWEWDEIIANGQNDRYGMTMTLAPSGTMLNEPRVSKTGGKWAWSVVPGAHTPDQSGTYLGGWSLGVSKYSKNKEWAFAFLQMVAGREWGRQSLERGNCTAHLSALNDPDVVKKFGWTPVASQALKTAIVDPQDPIYGALQLPLRSGISRVLLGQADAKEALDSVAVNWQRIMRRNSSL
jgi:ABC-type glycerol-3-phosphate transport system substrate-binding protein